MKSAGFHRMRWALALAVLFPLATNAIGANIVDFEDLDLSVPPAQAYTGVGGGAFWNGSDESGGFTSGDASFLNSYNTEYGSWEGWAYSNTIDTTTAGYTNQYSAYAGGAHSGTQYGVYFEPWVFTSTVTLAPGAPILGAWITNTTYAALSMLHGDPPPNAFAKKFGGASGDDPDWFKLTITGENSQGVTGEVDFYLADFRFANNGLDYIVDDWTWVDLTSLGNASRLTFGLSSSDNGQFGMNTPAQFAIDDIVTGEVPEPSTLAIFGVGGLVAGGIWLLRTRISRRKMTC